MDINQRISAQRSSQEFAQINARRTKETTDTNTTVSEDRSVQGERSGVVAGVSSDRRASLGQYRNLLTGSSLPVMTQLTSAEGTDESAARKALPQTKGSDEGERVGEVETSPSGEGQEANESGEADDAAREPIKDPSEAKSPTGEALSKEDQQEVDKLKARDREVRAHEQAHVAAGGQYVRGGISYDYQRGPDGRNYAVGGHVNIDVSAEKTPEATITKMQQVKRAALAPAEPSGADRAVAAEAAQKEQAARSELLEDRQTEAETRRTESVQKSTSSESSGAATGAEGAEEAPPAEALAASAPEVPKADTPQPREQMNLAREARMRIKRGVSWLA